MTQPSTTAPTGTKHRGGKHAIPVEGLREYWYPAVQAKKVRRRRPTIVTMLGREIAFFRTSKGVAAAPARCPHRGGKLTTCHFEGTVTCPYHGWTFDEKGECVAVLGEGPESKIPGRSSTRLEMFPTVTLKGLVFVWMGSGEPAPIREDIPPEFFDPKARVYVEMADWDCNWRPSVENYMDAHVFHVHRNSLLVLTLPWSKLRTFVPGNIIFPRPRALPPNALVLDETSYPDDPRPYEDTVRRSYPGLRGATWPRTNLRYRFSSLLQFLRFRTYTKTVDAGEGWTFMRLPGTLRNSLRRYVYTRTIVPVDAETTRSVYYQARFPGSRIRALFDTIMFQLYYRWYYNHQFSGQDARIVRDQDYETKEHLSSSDACVVAWRNLILKHARDFTREAAGEDDSPAPDENGEARSEEQAPSEESEERVGIRQ